MHTALANITAQLKILTDRQNSCFKPVIPAPSSNRTEEKPFILNTEDKHTLIQSAKSIDKILSLEPHLSTVDNGVLCQVCDVIISYDFNEGTFFESETQPRIFINFKKKIVCHFGAQMHKANIEKVDKILREDKDILSKAKEGGINCAALAYNSYYSYSSYRSYEYSIADVYNSGGNVGIKNHSKEFPRTFLPSIYKVMRKDLTDFIMNRHLPIGILADKMTVHHRTRHIIGVRIPLWDISCSDIVKDIYIQGSSVKHHTGDDIANHLIDSLVSAGIKLSYISKNIAGLAMDGQYTKLNTGKHVENIIDTVVNLSWDPMHRIQLAYDDQNKKKSKDDDSAKKSKYNFINSVVEVITAVTKESKSGQGYERVLEQSELLDTFLVPKLFKTMKFVAYSQRVFYTFQNNYPAYIASSELYEEAGIRDKLMSAGFVCDMLFLADVCGKLAHCSKQVQIAGLLPWKYPCYTECLKTDLNDMIDNIDKLKN